MTTTQTKVRANEYPGTCINCRGHVPAWEGSLNRTAAGWTVAHLDCHTQPATGWSNAAIARRGGSVAAANAGAKGHCIDCGAYDELTRGLCWNCGCDF